MHVGGMNVYNIPNVMYPTLFPVNASVPCSSCGGSECEKRTWGAVWLPLRPSLNSCMKTFPMTTSSSSVNIVENMTVTRSFWADTYLCVCVYGNFNNLDDQAHPPPPPTVLWMYLHCLLVSVVYNGCALPST